MQLFLLSLLGFWISEDHNFYNLHNILGTYSLNPS